MDLGAQFTLQPLAAAGNGLLQLLSLLLGLLNLRRAVVTLLACEPQNKQQHQIEATQDQQQPNRPFGHQRLPAKVLSGVSALPCVR